MVGIRTAGWDYRYTCEQFIDITMCNFKYTLALGFAVVTSVMGTYMPAGKEHFLTDALLREVVERMGKDLADAADNYLDFPDNSRLPVLGARTHKDLETEEQLFPIDYDSLGEANPNPSIRDQEYLGHSSLWGNQYMSGGAGEGKQRLKPEGTVKNHQEVKSDATLPAYCNPPNPCPIGYEEHQGCTSNLDFENTAAYSRRYQADQDCMCDTEHMFECPTQTGDAGRTDNMVDPIVDMDFNRFLQQTINNNEAAAHKNLVAKKFNIGKNYAQNPYLFGERLPVAAKKGINVGY
ncbi:7B2 [Carabus blaptoides fortunei]